MCQETSVKTDTLSCDDINKEYKIYYMHYLGQAREREREPGLSQLKEGCFETVSS